jgi:hypothetical protein
MSCNTHRTVELSSFEISTVVYTIRYCAVNSCEFPGNFSVNGFFGKNYTMK